ncbi:MAG: hypothetical protein R3A80_07860 [Bdellovibrionota bacterium]
MKKLLIALSMSPLFASAGLFELTCVSGNGLGACGAQGQTILNEVAAEINKNLPSASSKDEYFSGMSTANAMSAAGVTSSYGTVFERFLVGITASGGAHLGSKNFTDFGDLSDNPEQFRGFGAQAAIVFGANVGRLFGSEGGAFDLSKLNVYLSGFALNKKFGDVDTDYMGMGIGAQYRLMDGTNFTRLIRWTGLDVGAGLLYSKLKLDALINLNKTYTVTSGGNTYNAPFTGNADFDANVSTIMLPLEVSSAIRFFYFLKFVAGLGVDINMGKTDASGRLTNSSLTADAGGGNDVTGTATFDINGSGSPKVANARVFFGPHFEFGVGSIFVNVHKSLIENAVAVNTGLNFFW